jgi:hypothetical protein
MNRPNLLSLAAAAVLLSIASSEALAQYAPQYGPPGYGGPEYGPPQQQGHPPVFQMPRSQYQAPVVDHYVEHAPALWDENRPIEHFLHEVTSRSWVRLEFMQWSFQESKTGTIGAPVSGLQRLPPNSSLEGVQIPVAINNNLNGGNTAGLSLFPQADSLDLIDTPGARGTLGVAMNGGDLEMSFFGFEQKSDVAAYNNIDGPRQILAGLVVPGSLAVPIDPALGTATNPNYAIPLLTDGAVTDVAGLNSLIFDKSLQARYGSQMWGTELMFLTDRYIPGEGLGFQWLGGLRYTNLDESFGIHGTFDGGAAVADRTTDINSAVNSNYYGPEMGARMSVNTRWLTLSATPRIMMGLNDYTARLTSNALGTGATSFESHKINFGTITQINLAAEVHLSTKFSVYGGYDFMWLTQVSRPDQNVYYNSISGGAAGFTPDIRQNVGFSNFAANGFSLGAVFRY